MTRRDQAILWLQDLPDPLALEAADFIEFLRQKVQRPQQFQTRETAPGEECLDDLHGYADELRSYEELLAAGKIVRW